MPTETTLPTLIRNLDPQLEVNMSTTDLETRRALLSRLESGSTAAHPSPNARHRRRNALFVGTGLVTACIAASALFVSAQHAPSTSNFALSPSGVLEGWSTTPKLTVPTPADEAACVGVADPGGDPGASVSVLTSELRGRYTSIFMTVNGKLGYCILSGDDAIWMRGGSFSSDALDPAPVPSSVTTDWNGINDDSPSVGVIVTAHGRVGTDVTSLTLTLADGTSVQASVVDGNWSAWWPTTGDPGNGSQLNRMLNVTTTFTTVDGETHVAEPTIHSAGQAAEELKEAVS
jgi:hypothetical protein